MSPMQKFAWYNLSVIGLTLIVVVALYPFLGSRSMGGLGCLGFIGFSPFFFRKQRGKVIVDERDAVIQARSWIVAYSTFWVVFVLAAVVLTPAIYGEQGAVPVSVVQVSVAWGFIFVYAVASIAILAQYAGGPHDAGQ